MVIEGSESDVQRQREESIDKDRVEGNFTLRSKSKQTATKALQITTESCIFGRKELYIDSLHVIAKFCNFYNE